ncbi:MAG: hypothetical protein ACKVHO_03885 [Verrucomicrobiia bacterium]|jgi:hypothetical protein
MTYRIESIEVFVRETPPGRMAFLIGKQQGNQPPPKRRPRGILLCRMTMSDDRGRVVRGMSGDRPSFGWLDKRKHYDSDQKLQRLFALLESARKIWLAEPRFKSPFRQWLTCHSEVQRIGRETDHESLTASYVSALIERAMIDGVCRLHNLSVFDFLHQGKLDFDPGQVLPELRGVELSKILPPRPRTSFFVRHTVGLGDPILAADQPREKRINDGEPETLEEYIRQDGLRYFKVKIGGDPDADLDRLKRIWQAVVKADEPVVTLDGNESSKDIDAFARFVERFAKEIPGLFQHTSFIEQPLTRAVTHDAGTTQTIRRLSKMKPLVIDEADGNTTAFHHAFQIGYDGSSHKNCKGFIKSLINYALCRRFTDTTGRNAFQSGEDLSLMPLVPLHQDYAALGVLNIAHAERNGHHYSFGQGHLSAGEKVLATRHHPDLYTERRDELFLDIRKGKLNCKSLQCPGFGVRFEPEWERMTPLEKWTPIW